MAVKLGLWSLTLVPGEKYPLYIKHDFQITNAALSDELASADGRTVVKVTHHPVNPAMYADDSDSEIDSDDEELMGLDDDDLPEEDEFELDVEEGFKEVSKKGDKAAAKAAAKVNGDASMAEDDEDEDEEDDEDDDDFSDVEVEVTNVICALTAGKIEQANLNLTFTEGDAVMFEITGENAVHLMGNYIEQPNPYDSESDDEHDHDDYDEMYDDESDEEDEEELSATIQELVEPKKKAAAAIAPAKAKPAVAAAAAPAAAAATGAEKKRKADAIESPASKAPAAASAAGAAGAELSKAQKKKLAKKAKTDGGEASASPAQAGKAAPAAAGSQKRTTPSGLVIEDIKKGDGPAAKGGKRLSMRYIGKLTDGKQFDANTAGKPFSFVLGRGEVIKGWDEGLMGMAVGGERRLTIPASLAYGNQKLPGIPKNSTLKFDVKLLAVN